MAIHLQLFLSTFALIFVAELPDKTAFATVLLAARGRALPVFVGVALAFVVQTLVAVASGRLLARLPPEYIHLGAALLFFGFAVQAWRRSSAPDSEHDDPANGKDTTGFWRAAWTSFLVIFIAEWGDITQLATAALVAKTGDELTIFVAALSALWTVTALAVLLGGLMRRWVRPRLLQRIAAVAFFAVGSYLVINK